MKIKEKIAEIIDENVGTTIYSVGLENFEIANNLADQILSEIVKEIEKYEDKLIKEGAEEMSDVYQGKLNACQYLLKKLK